ncbi:MAG: helix-hairpin-helix domain-containing protein [Aerococcus sp.]|nr:helix-hairpin-helix domain-containing protein [Aerococcus sp.]
MEQIDWTQLLKQARTHWKAISTGVLIVIGMLIVVGMVILGGHDEVAKGEAWDSVETSEASLETTSSKDAAASSSSIKEQWYVDIKGAVNKPGVYPVDETMRVHDAVALAGGVAGEADETQVNFSQKVADQMVIYIPKQGEETKGAFQSPVASSSPQSSGNNKLVNINTATKEELMTISGIGEKKAEDIVNYREQNGSFQSVDDLSKVSGIGAKTVEKLRAEVCV